MIFVTFKNSPLQPGRVVGLTSRYEKHKQYTTIWGGFYFRSRLCCAFDVSRND